MKKRYDIITFRWSAGILAAYLLVAVFSPFIAGEKPIFCVENGQWTFPVFTSNPVFNATVNKNSERCLLPLIPYSPKNIDPSHQSGTGPLDNQPHLSLRQRHWLGTDRLGRDVASGMVHGTVIALKIGLLSVLFSFIFGVSVGMISSYYKDNDSTVHAFRLMLYILIIWFGAFYLFTELTMFNSGYLYLFSILSLSLLLLVIVNRLPDAFFPGKKIAVPLDTIVVKIIEIRKSFPGLFLLLALSGLFTTPSLWNIIWIITILGWTDFARYARAETLSVREENYITAAKITGYNDVRILFRHVLPNILPTLIVVACFSVSSAILLESTLSFLGVGLPVEEVSWGKMMAEGRNMRLWWLIVFPGMALFMIIFSINNVAEFIQHNGMNFKIHSSPKLPKH